MSDCQCLSKFRFSRSKPKMIQKIGIVEPGKEGCMTERNRKGGLRTGGMRNGRDAGKEGYMKGGIRDWTGGIQD